MFDRPSSLPAPRRELRWRWGALGLGIAVLAGCGEVGRDKVDNRGGPHAAGATSSGGMGASTGVGAAGSSATGGSATLGPGVNLAGNPKYFRFVRLTNAQWGATVQALLKLPEPSGLEATFEAPVVGTTDFSNNELLLDVTSRHWSDFQAAAEELAERVTKSEAALAAIYPGTDAAGFIESFGRRAYRRPLTAGEVSVYSELFTQGSAMSGDKSAFAKGAALVIRAFLQSPHFLYRTELGKNGEPLSGYEATAKLSLWLRGAAPDDALLDAAETLTTPDALARAATKLLASATPSMRQFYGELLHFERYRQVSKVGVSFDPAVPDELIESSYLFFDEIFSAGLGVRSILTSTRGYMGPRMAPLYGLPSPSSGFVAVELGAPRLGYFAQLPYLIGHSVNADSDVMHRGLGLALDVLCSPLGPPVAEIPPIPEPQPGQTRRQRLEALTADCGGTCHNAIMNPLGFAFEHFDGMGQYRDLEQGGLPVDSSGSYAFSDGKVEFADHTELMQAMAESNDAHLCYSKKLASFGLQRDITQADLPWLRELSKLSLQGGSTQDLVLALIRSDAFRTHGGAP